MKPGKAATSLHRRAESKCLFLFAVILISGCSIKSMAVDAAADAMAQSGSAYGSDNDIEFVGMATPFGLKTIESLLDATPDHRGLLLAATRGFTQYSYVYIDQPANEIETIDISQAYAERKRAHRMYLRARDYGLRGLAVEHPEIIDAIRREPRDAVANTTIEDVGLLYWTAASWAAAISLAKDDPRLVADLPVIEALIYRAYELDEAFDQGAVHVFLISYEMSQSGLHAGASDRALQHFQRAVELSEGRQAAPYVALAEALAIPENDAEEFDRLLNEALAIGVDSKSDQRLANLVMQRRARWLLANKEQYFLE